MAVRSYLKPREDKATKKAVVAETVAAAVEETVEMPVITDDDLLSPSLDDLKTEAVAVHAAATAVPSGSITMTPSDIAALVAATVAAVNKEGNKGIADVIATALTQHMGPRKLTMADIGEVKTPFNPMGKKRELLKDFSQNGFPLMERFLSDQEIEMLHQLVPGSYGPPEFPIAVIERKRLNGKTRVHIMFDGSKDGRMREKNYSTTFYGFLAKLVQESKDQLVERKRAAKEFLDLNS